MYVGDDVFLVDLSVGIPKPLPFVGIIFSKGITTNRSRSS